MPPKKANSRVKLTSGRAKAPARSDSASGRPIEEQVQEAVDWLKAHATKATRDGMARYAIPSDHALGVSMSEMQKLAKSLGRNHPLAAGLWAAGWYEARMLATLIDEPALVTPAQMESWCRDFDSWAICDTACFHLFDRTPHAFRKVAQWADRPAEFVKRAAFALLACLALHDKQTADQPFLDGLPLVERAATDERNFVKKGVNWALRAVGERSPALYTAAMAVARRLAESPQAAPRWVGKSALREFARPAVIRRLAACAGIAPPSRITTSFDR